MKRIEYNGSVYIGEVSDDSTPNGVGMLVNADGSVEFGNFCRSFSTEPPALKRNPSGDIAMFGDNVASCLFVTTGDRYEGEVDLSSLTRNGYGVLTFMEGTTYSGEFKNGIMSGLGVLQRVRGTSYLGEFDHDLPQGYGCLFIGSGSYQGQFLRGKRHGYGAYTDGKVENRGEWRDDELFRLGDFDGNVQSSIEAALAAMETTSSRVLSAVNAAQLRTETIRSRVIKLCFKVRLIRASVNEELGLTSAEEDIQIFGKGFDWQALTSTLSLSLSARKAGEASVIHRPTQDPFSQDISLPRTRDTMTSPFSAIRQSMAPQHVPTINVGVNSLETESNTASMKMHRTGTEEQVSADIRHDARGMSYSDGQSADVYSGQAGIVSELLIDQHRGMRQGLGRGLTPPKVTHLSRGQNQSSTHRLSSIGNSGLAHSTVGLSPFGEERLFISNGDVSSQAEREDRLRSLFSTGRSVSSDEAMSEPQQPGARTRTQEVFDAPTGNGIDHSGHWNGAHSPFESIGTGATDDSSVFGGAVDGPSLMSHKQDVRVALLEGKGVQGELRASRRSQPFTSAGGLFSNDVTLNETGHFFGKILVSTSVPKPSDHDGDTFEVGSASSFVFSPDKRLNQMLTASTNLDRTFASDPHAVSSVRAGHSHKGLSLANEGSPLAQDLPHATLDRPTIRKGLRRLPSKSSYALDDVSSTQFSVLSQPHARDELKQKHRMLNDPPLHVNGHYASVPTRLEFSSGRGIGNQQEQEALNDEWQDIGAMQARLSRESDKFPRERPARSSLPQELAVMHESGTYHAQLDSSEVVAINTHDLYSPSNEPATELRLSASAPSGQREYVSGQQAFSTSLTNGIATNVVATQSRRSGSASEAAYSPLSGPSGDGTLHMRHYLRSLHTGDATDLTVGRHSQSVLVSRKRSSPRQGLVQGGEMSVFSSAQPADMNGDDHSDSSIRSLPKFAALKADLALSTFRFDTSDRLTNRIFNPSTASHPNSASTYGSTLGDDHDAIDSWESLGSLSGQKSDGHRTGASLGTHNNVLLFSASNTDSLLVTSPQRLNQPANSTWGDLEIGDRDGQYVQTNRRTDLQTLRQPGKGVQTNGSVWTNQQEGFLDYRQEGSDLAFKKEQMESGTTGFAELMHTDSSFNLEKRHQNSETNLDYAGDEFEGLQAPTFSGDHASMAYGKMQAASSHFPSMTIERLALDRDSNFSPLNQSGKLELHNLYISGNHPQRRLEASGVDGPEMTITRLFRSEPFNAVNLTGASAQHIDHDFSSSSFQTRGLTGNVDSRISRLGETMSTVDSSHLPSLTLGTSEAPALHLSEPQYLVHWKKTGQSEEGTIGGDFAQVGFGDGNNVGFRAIDSRTGKVDRAEERYFDVRNARDRAGEYTASNEKDLVGSNSPFADTSANIGSAHGFTNLASVRNATQQRSADGSFISLRKGWSLEREAIRERDGAQDASSEYDSFALTGQARTKPTRLANPRRGRDGQEVTFQPDIRFSRLLPEESSYLALASDDTTGQVMVQRKRQPGAKAESPEDDDYVVLSGRSSLSPRRMNMTFGLDKMAEKGQAKAFEDDRQQSPDGKSSFVSLLNPLGNLNGPAKFQQKQQYDTEAKSIDYVKLSAQSSISPERMISLAHEKKAGDGKYATFEYDDLTQTHSGESSYVSLLPSSNDVIGRVIVRKKSRSEVGATAKEIGDEESFVKLSGQSSEMQRLYTAQGKPSGKGPTASFGDIGVQHYRGESSYLDLVHAPEEGSRQATIDRKPRQGADTGVNEQEEIDGFVELAGQSSASPVWLLQPVTGLEGKIVKGQRALVEDGSVRLHRDESFYVNLLQATKDGSSEVMVHLNPRLGTVASLDGHDKDNALNQASASPGRISRNYEAGFSEQSKASTETDNAGANESSYVSLTRATRNVKDGTGFSRKQPIGASHDEQDALSHHGLATSAAGLFTDLQMPRDPNSQEQRSSRRTGAERDDGKLESDERRDQEPGYVNSMRGQTGDRFDSSRDRMENTTSLESSRELWFAKNFGRVSANAVDLNEQNFVQQHSQHGYLHLSSSRNADNQSRSIFQLERQRSLIQPGLLSGSLGGNETDFRIQNDGTEEVSLRRRRADSGTLLLRGEHRPGSAPPPEGSEFTYLRDYPNRRSLFRSRSGDPSLFGDTKNVARFGNGMSAASSSLHRSFGSASDLRLEESDKLVGDDLLFQSGRRASAVPLPDSVPNADGLRMTKGASEGFLLRTSKSASKRSANQTGIAEDDVNDLTASYESDDENELYHTNYDSVNGRNLRLHVEPSMRGNPTGQKALREGETAEYVQMSRPIRWRNNDPEFRNLRTEVSPGGALLKLGGAAQLHSHFHDIAEVQDGDGLRESGDGADGEPASAGEPTRLRFNESAKAQREVQALNSRMSLNQDALFSDGRNASRSRLERVEFHDLEMTGEQSRFELPEFRLRDWKASREFNGDSKQYHEPEPLYAEDYLREGALHLSRAAAGTISSLSRANQSGYIGSDSREIGDDGFLEVRWSTSRPGRTSGGEGITSNLFSDESNSTSRFLLSKAGTGNSLDRAVADSDLKSPAHAGAVQDQSSTSARPLMGSQDNVSPHRDRAALHLTRDLQDANLAQDLENQARRGDISIIDFGHDPASSRGLWMGSGSNQDATVKSQVGARQLRKYPDNATGHLELSRKEDGVQNFDPDRESDIPLQRGVRDPSLARGIVTKGSQEYVILKKEEISGPTDHLYGRMGEGLDAGDPLQNTSRFRQQIDVSFIELRQGAAISDPLGLEASREAQNARSESPGSRHFTGSKDRANRGEHGFVPLSYEKSQAREQNYAESKELSHNHATSQNMAANELHERYHIVFDADGSVDDSDVDRSSSMFTRLVSGQALATHAKLDYVARGQLDDDKLESSYVDLRVTIGTALAENDWRRDMHAHAATVERAGANDTDSKATHTPARNSPANMVTAVTSRGLSGSLSSINSRMKLATKEFAEEGAAEPDLSNPVLMNEHNLRFGRLQEVRGLDDNFTRSQTIGDGEVQANLWRKTLTSDPRSANDETNQYIKRDLWTRHEDQAQGHGRTLPTPATKSAVAGSLFMYPEGSTTENSIFDQNIDQLYAESSTVADRKSPSGPGKGGQHNFITQIRLPCEQIPSSSFESFDSYPLQTSAFNENSEANGRGGRVGDGIISGISKAEYVDHGSSNTFSSTVAFEQRRKINMNWSSVPPARIVNSSFQMPARATFEDVRMGVLSSSGIPHLGLTSPEYAVPVRRSPLEQESHTITSTSPSHLQRSDTFPPLPDSPPPPVDSPVSFQEDEDDESFRSPSAPPLPPPGLPHAPLRPPYPPSD